VRWYGPQGPVDMSATSRQLAFCLRGASQTDVDLYVMINMAPEEVLFAVQVGPARRWARVVDTGRAAPDDIREPDGNDCLQSLAYTVQQRSVVVLVASS
jgi:isoamylase